MPWKDRKGTTQQIAIYPPESSMKLLNFEFRLSSASISERSTFSKFLGYDRILLPIKGRGFLLNGAEYERHEVAYFSGSDEIICELIDGEVLDLGLIFDPRVLKANVKLLKFKKQFILNKDAESTYFIYVLQGDLTLGDQAGNQNDTFMVKLSENLHFKTTKDCTLAVFELRFIETTS